VPARFSVLVALSLAVLSGYGVRRFMSLSSSPRVAQVTFATAIAASVINVWPNLPLEPLWRQPPPVYGALAGARHVVLAEFPVPDDYAYNTPYMYFALWHWAPLVNGYSGFMPRSYDDFQRGIGDFPGPVALATLRMQGVTHVTVNCALYGRDALCDALLARVDHTPDFRTIAEARWQGARVKLYELKR
jgi:hypothetical protein